MIGEDVNVCPTSMVLEAAVVIFITPLGNPARRASSHKALTVKGVSPGDLRTTVQPAAKAGATFLKIGNGKLSALNVHPDCIKGCTLHSCLPGDHSRREIPTISCQYVWSTTRFTSIVNCLQEALTV